jgi:transposase
VRPKADLERRRAELDEQIEQLAAEPTEFPMRAKLQQVPGIGPVVSAAVLACLTDKRFAHPDEFVAYTGLAIKVRESGKFKGKRKLCKEGDAELRRLLFVAVRSSLRCKTSPFKAQFERERGKGLSTTAATCAVARKIARLCWSMWKHEQDYDPERVYQQPRKGEDPPAVN